MSYQKSQAKARQTASVEEISPTQSTHPPHNSMRGVRIMIPLGNAYPPR